MGGVLYPQESLGRKQCVNYPFRETEFPPLKLYCFYSSSKLIDYKPHLGFHSVNPQLEILKIPGVEGVAFHIPGGTGNWGSIPLRKVDRLIWQCEVRGSWTLERLCEPSSGLGSSHTPGPDPRLSTCRDGAWHPGAT